MKNSLEREIYDIITDSKSDSISHRKKDFESLKKDLEFEVNSTRSLYYINNMKELMYVLKKRALPEAVEKSAYESILRFVRVRKSNDKGGSRSTPSELPFDVMDLVATKIGFDWIDLSRYLGVSDYTIEEIEMRYPNQLKQRAYQALLTFSRETRSGDEMKMRLVQALTKVRRIDLRNDVEKIFQELNQE